MKYSTTFILLNILFLSAVLIDAASIGSGNLRCQCIKLTTDFIHPKFMSEMDIIAQGPHCSRTEYIAILKSGVKICLDFEQNWVKRIIQFMGRKQN